MLASTTSPACSAAWDTGLGCGAGTDPPGKHPVVRESRKHSNAWGTGGNPPYPTNPSSFSEGDWRHCYVGLEGPVVPSEKVLGSRLKYPEGSAHIRTLHGGRGRSLDHSQGWVGGRGAEPKSRAFLRVRILRVQYGSESKFMVES